MEGSEWKAAGSERNTGLQEQGWKERKWLSKGIPFPAIREDDKKTGDETFLGEISIRRSGFIMKMDQDEKEDERCEWCA